VLQVLTELAGTMGYIAPEVLQRCYTEQADVWSTGVMLYEMVCGQLPYRLGNTCEEVSNMLHACASWCCCSVGQRQEVRLWPVSWDPAYLWQVMMFCICQQKNGMAYLGIGVKHMTVSHQSQTTLLTCQCV
jgi:hypothetical protein